MLCTAKTFFDNYEICRVWVLSIHISSKQFVAQQLNWALNIWASFLRNLLEVIFPHRLRYLWISLTIWDLNRYHIFFSSRLSLPRNTVGIQIPDSQMIQNSLIVECYVIYAMIWKLNWIVRYLNGLVFRPQIEHQTIPIARLLINFSIKWSSLMRWGVDFSIDGSVAVRFGFTFD
jgi:hypothetical protein